MVQNDPPSNLHKDGNGHLLVLRTMVYKNPGPHSVTLQQVESSEVQNMKNMVHFSRHIRQVFPIWIIRDSVRGAGQDFSAP